MGQGSGVAMSCGVGCRSSWDLALLWLCCRPVATAPVRLLAWEPPYAIGVTLKKKKENDTGYNNLTRLTECKRGFSDITWEMVEDDELD